MSDLFAELAAGFMTDDIDGGAVGDLVQPRREDDIGREAMRLATHKLPIKCKFVTREGNLFEG